MENKKIVDYLLSCGMNPQFKGFRYMYEAIVMTIKNNYEMPRITKVIYPAISEKYNDTISKVERACRNIVKTANKEYKCMTCGEFIAKSAIKIKFAR